MICNGSRLVLTVCWFVLSCAWGCSAKTPSQSLQDRVATWSDHSIFTVEPGDVEAVIAAGEEGQRIVEEALIARSHERRLRAASIFCWIRFSHRARACSVCRAAYESEPLPGVRRRIIRGLIFQSGMSEENRKFARERWENEEDELCKVLLATLILDEESTEAGRAARAVVGKILEDGKRGCNSANQYQRTECGGRVLCATFAVTASGTSNADLINAVSEIAGSPRNPEWLQFQMKKVMQEIRAGEVVHF